MSRVKTEWSKRPAFRWKCARCGAEGWSFKNSLPPDDHDALTGRRCVPRK